MKKAIIKLFVLIAVLVGVGYVAYFGTDDKGYGSAKGIKLGLDLNGGLSITFEAVEPNPSRQDMEDAKKKLVKRIEKYSTEANVYIEGDNRINVEIPLKNTSMEGAKEILADLGNPGTLEFVDTDGNVIITGADVKKAEPLVAESNTGGNQYLVGLTLTEEGAKKFAEGTARVAQKTDNTIAIIYDGNQISNPRCEKAIEGGEVTIDGMPSYEAASELATYIRIGAMPIELKTLRSNIVAPQLGSDAIKTSLMAAAIGIALVVVFMCAVYRVPGLAASIALALYVGLVIFTVSSFEITLTLPGIAGIVLSIGMAVDANVIIFARIREELGTGISVATAISNGFNKAFGAIFDGNITTLIAAAVLYGLGSGTIKGFAATLAIGIILSMFTALVVTKFILKMFYELGAKSEKLYGVQKPRKTVNFLGKKHIYLIVSLVLILMGPVCMIVNNSNGKGFLNLGIEFAGGSSISVTFNENMSQEKLESEVVPIIAEITGSKEVQVQRVEGSNEVVFKTQELDVEKGEGDAISDALVEKYGIDPSRVTLDNISSTISGEMRQDAIVAIVIATIAMLLYIWFRFRNIRFASSAIIALVHDVLVVLAFYALTRITVGSTFIACMLTIVGYSINATIVIFDRIREYLKNQNKKDTLEDVVNKSITDTLTRSINTSITTFVMVLMLYILGVTSIREFAFPIMVGIICGGYSSICITGTLWYTFMSKFPPKEEEDEE